MFNNKNTIFPSSFAQEPPQRQESLSDRYSGSSSAITPIPSNSYQHPSPIPCFVPKERHVGVWHPRHPTLSLPSGVLSSHWNLSNPSGFSRTPPVWGAFPNNQCPHCLPSHFHVSLIPPTIAYVPQRLGLTSSRGQLPLSLCAVCKGVSVECLMYLYSIY